MWLNRAEKLLLCSKPPNPNLHYEVPVGSTVWCRMPDNSIRLFGQTVFEEDYRQ